MTPPLLLLQDIRIRFGQSQLIEDAELSVGPHERLCLVGRNGSGKSTFLKIAAGLIDPDGGTRFLQPGTTIQYLPQEPDFGEATTALEYVEAGLGEAGNLFRARLLLESLGLTGEEDVRQMSGGEERRASLARVLAPEPDILLLDEPTNHLDLSIIESLERTLKGLRSAIVIISHDRRFLENLSSATVWIDRRRTRRLNRGFDAFETWRDSVLEEEELNRHKLDRKIAREEDWLRYGVTGRRKRNQRRLADFRLLRAERTTRRQETASKHVDFGRTELRTAGKLVIEAEAIAKSYGNRSIVRDFSVKVERGDRVGIVGPNGAGKTTLVRLLTGDLGPDTGSIKLGTKLDIASLDQRREALNNDMSVADALTGGDSDNVVVNGRARHVVGYLKDFLFLPEQARSPVKVLSGGERARLMLARALATSANLLVLDEPTNDLDLETLDLLQEMLIDYDGTLILVSHDRDFLDRVVTSIVASEGDGTWTEYAGGYSDMLAQRGSKIGDRAKPDKRVSQSASVSKSATSGRRKLSFAEQHALKTLPARINRLASDIERLEVELADPSLFQRDPKKQVAIADAHRTALLELEEAEDAWLQVELRKEEIEG